MTLDHLGNLGRPLRADAERNRRRILAAAAEVFAKRGLDAGLDEIARHAGVGTGTVYRRFPDKALLIDALFESRIDDLLEVADTALSVPDAWDGLVHFLTRTVEMQLADRGLKEMMFGDAGVADAARGRFATKIDILVPRMAALMQRAQKAGQLRPDVGLADLALIQFMLHGIGGFTDSVDPDQWRRQLGLLLAGLRVDQTFVVPLPSQPLTLDELQEICSPTEATAAAEADRSRA